MDKNLIAMQCKSCGAPIKVAKKKVDIDISQGKTVITMKDGEGKAKCEYCGNEYYISTQHLSPDNWQPTTVIASHGSAVAIGPGAKAVAPGAIYIEGGHKGNLTIFTSSGRNKRRKS